MARAIQQLSEMSLSDIVVIHELLNEQAKNDSGNLSDDEAMLAESRVHMVEAEMIQRLEFIDFEK